MQNVKVLRAQPYHMLPAPAVLFLTKWARIFLGNPIFIDRSKVTFNTAIRSKSLPLTFLSLALVPAPVPVPVWAQALEQTDAQSISNMILTHVQRQPEERLGALVPTRGIIVDFQTQRAWKPQDFTMSLKTQCWTPWRGPRPEGAGRESS